MYEQEQEERDFHVSSDSEWDRAEAYDIGELYPERAWVNTDRDVWHKNPFYKGPPVPHPEDDSREDCETCQRYGACVCYVDQDSSQEVIVSAHIERDMLDDMPF
jgi:hypothetical protein